MNTRRIAIARRNATTLASVMVNRALLELNHSDRLSFIETRARRVRALEFLAEARTALDRLLELSGPNPE